MMLDIFPQGALDSSVVTTVWVGLSVIALLNLRFGTTLSGLVVPGYLVPLLLAKPLAAWTTIAEGLLTYALSWLIARQLLRWSGASEMFGRDRFFAIVFLSIVVRALSDAYLLPAAAGWLNAHGYSVDFQFDLHSFGLVIVSLIANQMWNGGWRKGVFSLALYTVLTLLLVRYVLMTFTNFSIGNLGYMYEDIATSILASPKAYIILLVTAYMASRLNLHYGWEFNGIMLPALLALQWYQPLKLLATLTEGVIIFLLARQTLRLPWFAKRNMEGARLLLLFFSVGYFYKMLLGYVLPLCLPGAKVSDYYAFGYLLSTLLAIKMHQKDIAIRLTRATVQTSLVGLLIATLMGFVLSLALPAKALITTAVARPAGIAQDDATQRWNKIRTAIYASENAAGGVVPTSFELARFETACHDLARYLATGAADDWQRSVAAFASVRYRLEASAGTIFLLDAEPARGWGFYALKRNAANALTLEIPAALNERNALDAGIVLFTRLDARALAISGARLDRHPDNRMDVLQKSNLPFDVFHRVFAQQTLQLRVDWTQEGRSEGSVLWVKRALPPALTLGEIAGLSGDLQLQWRARETPNLQAQRQFDQFAEWVLSPAAARRLIARSINTQWQEQSLRTVDLSGYLHKTLLQSRQQIADSGSEAYRIASLSELLFVHDEILRPLLSVLQRETQWPFDEAGAQTLQHIAAQAAVVDYELVHLHSAENGCDYLLLREKAGTVHTRYWGTYVFSVAPQLATLVEVPRPLSETQTLSFAVGWFESTRAAALLLAGAHENANADGAADVLLSSNKLTMFSLVHQSLLETAQSPLLALQVRGIAVDSAAQLNQSNALLSYREQKPRAALGTVAIATEQALSDSGLQWRRVGGRWESGRYGSVNNAQTRYLPGNHGMAVLWLAPTLKESFRNQADDDGEARKFDAMNVATHEESLRERLRALHFIALSPAEQRRLQLRWQGFLQTRDVVSLQRALSGEFGYERIIDVNSGAAFLLMKRPRGAVALLNLNSHLSGTVACSRPESYLQRHERWLMAGSGETCGGDAP